MPTAQHVACTIPGQSKLHIDLRIRVNEEYLVSNIFIDVAMLD